MSAEEGFPSYELSTLDEVFGGHGLDVELERIANASGILPAGVSVLLAGGSAVIRVDVYPADQPLGDPRVLPVGGFTWQRWDEDPGTIYWQDVSVALEYRNQGFLDHFTYNVADYIRERLGVRYVAVPDNGITGSITAMLAQIGFEEVGTERGPGWVGDLEPGSRHMEYVRWRQGVAPEPAWRG